MNDGAVAPGEDEPDTTALAQRRRIAPGSPPGADIEAVDGEPDETTFAAPRRRTDAGADGADADFDDDTRRTRPAPPAARRDSVWAQDPAAPRRSSSPAPGRAGPAYPIRAIPPALAHARDEDPRVPEDVVDGAAVERAIRGRARRRAVVLAALVVAVMVVAGSLLVVLLVFAR